MAHNRVFVIGRRTPNFFWGIAASITFTVIGVILFNTPESTIATWGRNNHPTFIHNVGIFLIVFGMVLISTVHAENRSNEPAIIINEEFIKIYNFNSIYWSEIESFSLSYQYKGGLILVHIKDKNTYIKKAPWLKRMSLRLSSFGFPTPIMISGFLLLNTDLKDLYNILNSELDLYRKNID